MEVSSANKKKEANLEEVKMSLIYIRKRIGDRILPCGTPMEILHFEEAES